MGDFEKNDFKRDSDTVFSKVVKAGKRTYFFDVKTTRQNEHYITVTESKKIFEDNGGAHFEKHKIFLYKEDFEKFMDAFDEVLDYVDEHNGEVPAKDKDPELDADKFTSVDYDDLDK